MACGGDRYILELLGESTLPGRADEQVKDTSLSIPTKAKPKEKENGSSSIVARSKSVSVPQAGSLE